MHFLFFACLRLAPRTDLLCAVLRYCRRYDPTQYVRDQEMKRKQSQVNLAEASFQF